MPRALGVVMPLMLGRGTRVAAVLSALPPSRPARSGAAVVGTMPTRPIDGLVRVCPRSHLWFHAAFMVSRYGRRAPTTPLTSPDAPAQRGPRRYAAGAALV